MIHVRLAVLMLGLITTPAAAQVAPAAIRVPQPTAWTGQRLPFFVELRTRGSFGGAASFSLPQIPRTVMIKVGNPVISSQDIDGESWFVQTHEFALFSQQTGPVEIPAVEVRFASRDGFTGPVTEQAVKTPAVQVEIHRPPQSDSLGFLITTESIEITETWDPRPGPAQVGAVLTRTISQRADQMTGIAFSPPPSDAPDGVRVYLGQPEVIDSTERGAFVGQRRDTLTYLLQESGTVTLPEITYTWWNPQTEKIQSKTLPAVTFEVAPAAEPAVEDAAGGRPPWAAYLLVALLVGAVGGLGYSHRRRIAGWIQKGRHALNPPERVAARQLIGACRRHDAAAAGAAWAAWSTLQPPAFEPDPRLRAAVVDLQRHRFGPAREGPWCGLELERAFRELRSTAPTRAAQVAPPALPQLNPKRVESRQAIG